ncbi:MAG TPA: phytanoyl-CoA dioxygenase family protein [Acidimicrobiales bacterium]|nr:phytanoyl-CoA dioxygenase family protein [Acidimicrobiales bacterium]
MGAGEPLGAFERDGYAVYLSVIDADLVGEARAHVDWLLARHPGVRPEHLGHDLMTDDPFWVRLVADERLLDVAQLFVGPDIALFASHYIAKPPHDGQAVLWHQDAGYWPLDPMEVVTLWLALDHSDRDNGCLRVVPGSHRGEVHGWRPRTDVANVLSSEIAADVDEAAAVDVVVPAGGVSVHHPAIVHGSDANRSARWRRGLTIRYIPASTRILCGDGGGGAAGGGPAWPSAFLLRGRAVEGVNAYNPFPRWIEGRHMPFRGCEEWT